MMPHSHIGHACLRQSLIVEPQGKSTMKRRQFIHRSLLAATIASFSATFSATAVAQVRAGSARLEPLPKRRKVRVAFMLGEGANVIDTAGPWEVFQDVMMEGLIFDAHPFELFTVGPSEEMITMTGGLEVKPHYSIRNAPQPNVIVVPAQSATDDTRAWLRDASAKTDVTMSVCTGAFQLARAGLLDGIPATTHHQFWDQFAKEFPDIELRRGMRFVDNGRIATAGGLTSGIDMALHIVARYFGVEAAEKTAAYMEYTSEAWRAT
jgi:transcriptional regulator GlxA family with amidase domain